MGIQCGLIEFLDVVEYGGFAGEKGDGDNSKRPYIDCGGVLFFAAEFPVLSAKNLKQVKEDLRCLVGACAY